MTTKLKSIKKSNKIQKFLRLPVDEKTQIMIDEIISDNPFFTPLDAVRYILGKHIRQSNKNKMLNFLKENVGDKNLPKLNEDEIFELLEKQKLVR